MTGFNLDKEILLSHMRRNSAREDRPQDVFGAHRREHNTSLFHVDSVGPEQILTTCLESTHTDLIGLKLYFNGYECTRRFHMSGENVERIKVGTILRLEVRQIANRELPGVMTTRFYIERE